jgi:hypothetical protein
MVRGCLLKKVSKDTNLSFVLFGLTPLAELSTSQNRWRLASLRTLLWALRQVEGVAVHILKAQGKLYVYNEYPLKEICHSIDPGKALTKEGVESLIRVQISQKQGILYSLIQTPVAVTEDITSILNAAKRILTQAPQEAFTSFDETKLIYRAERLASRAFELNRPAIYTAFIATRNRPQALKEQLESELENWCIFNRRIRLVVIDFSRKEIFAENATTLTSLRNKYGIEMKHIGTGDLDKDERLWARQMSEAMQKEFYAGRLDPVIKEVLERNKVLKQGKIDADEMFRYIDNNIFWDISGVRNYTLLKGMGDPVVMNFDDDAPPETYVLLPEQRAALRRQRAQNRQAQMKALLKEASEVMGRTIKTEDALYQASANLDDYAKLKPLFSKYLDYAQDGTTGLIPQAIGEIVALAERYVDKDLKITHQRYEELMTPLPEYMVTISDFQYRRPRTEKQDRQFQILPVNIFAAARFVGMKAADTHMPVMGQNLRMTMAEPVSLEKAQAIREKNISYVAFSFGLDQDTGGEAQ